jgi:hypothetical protein
MIDKTYQLEWRFCLKHIVSFEIIGNASNNIMEHPNTSNLIISKLIGGKQCLGGVPDGYMNYNLNRANHGVLDTKETAY